jgi:hypothetical protein
MTVCPGLVSFAPRAAPGEDRVVTVDVESALFRRDVQRHQGDRDVDVEEHSTLKAVHVIVPFYSPVVPACLIRERQLLDQPVLREEVQRPVNRAVADAWIASSHALEDLAGGQVALRAAHCLEDLSPLCCVSESLPRHRIAKRDNESQ